jgi:osmotically inducible protein OsmC
MATRNANAVWTGTLKEGKGIMKFGTYEGAYTWSSRFEDGQGTNPEELLGAAHAGCFSMALSSNIAKNGFTPKTINTQAQVTLEVIDGKSRITKIHLTTEAVVPDISDEKFQEIAATVKEGCPVSAALASTPITLTARLLAE